MEEALDLSFDRLMMIMMIVWLLEYMYIYIYIVTCLIAQHMDNFKVTYSEFINKLYVQQISEFK